MINLKSDIRESVWSVTLCDLDKTKGAVFDKNITFLFLIKMSHCILKRFQVTNLPNFSNNFILDFKLPFKSLGKL